MFVDSNRSHPAGGRLAATLRPPVSRRPARPLSPRYCVALLCAVLLFALPPAASARPSTASASNLGVANDYNVFVFGSGTLETGGSTIEGRLAVGGLARTRNYSVAPNVPRTDAQVPYNVVFGGNGNTTATTFSGTFYGSLVSDATLTTVSVPDVRGNIHARRALDLGGNNGWGGTVQGDALYGTTFRKDANVSVTGQTRQDGTTVLPFSFATVESDLRNLSTRLKSLAATGTTTVQSWGAIRCAGTNPGLNVFTVQIADLNRCSGFEISVPAGATALINFPGTATPALQNFSFTLSSGAEQSKVLFHFPDAAAVGFGTSGGIEVKGSVLAPNAAVNFGNGQVGGTLICKSLTATGLFKHVPFTGNLGGAPAAAALLSLSVTPASVIGGQANATGAVTLSGVAPPGGAVVTLGSSNGPVAGTPASVTVPAGATGATFPVVTNAVTMATPVSISASYGGVGKSAPLTVNPPPAMVLSFVVTPTSVVGGNPASAIVTLSAPAPPGGAVITLSSANAGVATLPTSVLIPAGATQSAAVTVTTTPSASTASVVLTAVYNGSSKSATLTVTAPVLLSVSVSPASVKGGVANATGTVTLSGNAPAGGLTVALSSSATGAAATPANVTVAAGSTTATFTVTSKPVAGDTDVTVSATLAAATKTAPLRVLAPSLVSVGVTPVSVVGGEPAQGNATIDAPAPTGGLTVALSSSSTKATVPGSVDIPAGATESAAFTVSTVAVATDTAATITGTLSGVSKSATVTITAPKLASLAFSPNPVRGGSASTGTVTLASPAPDSFVVDLASASGKVAVPTRLTIPAGATSATFSATTQIVGAETPVVVTASRGADAARATLTLLPTNLVSLTVASDVSPTLPGTIVGGDPATGTVRISAALPTDTTVTLATSLPGKVTVPETLVIAAGETSATFPVTTKAVPTDAPFTVTATWQGESKSAAVTLLAPRIKSLTFAPNPVAGGMGSVGTVELTGPAPEEGLTVAVASANPTVALPAATHITFVGNETAQTFAATTSAVATDTAVSFSVTLNGASTVADLVVTAPKIFLVSLTVAPGSVTGGNDAVATATISLPAPAGDVLVSVSSDSDKARGETATLRIPAGQTVGTVTIKTVPVAADALATLTAAFGGVIKTAPLTVLAPVLESVALNPSVVPGGKPTTGTVTLSGRAPDGGMIVALSSSDPATAKLPNPASVTIPDGETSAVFLLQTVPVARETTATITGTLNGTAKSAELTVRPPTLLAVAVKPNAVKSGAGSTGTVTISGNAPAGGLSVTLASDKPSVTFPDGSTVTVAAGAKSADFAVATGNVATTQVARITGTLDGVSRAAELTVLPSGVSGDGVLLRLVIAPKTVLGGGVAVAEVSLVSATDGTPVLVSAPGGATVTLVSDKPDTVVAGLPPQIVIAPGQSKAAFTLVGGVVNEPTTATITATYAGATATDTLTVAPEPCGGTGTATVAELTFSRGSVSGGVPLPAVTGTVSLSAPARAGGALVRLFAADPAHESFVSFPRYVWVPGGADVATFPVTTRPVGASTGVRVTAEGGGTSASGTLTVIPGLESGGAAGGGSGVSGGPTLTPAAIARGFRMTTFLSGLNNTNPTTAVNWLLPLANGNVYFRAFDVILPGESTVGKTAILADRDYQTLGDRLQTISLNRPNGGSISSSTAMIRSGASVFSVGSQSPVFEWDQETWTVKRTLVGPFQLRSTSNYDADLDPRTGKMIANVYRFDLNAGGFERYLYDWVWAGFRWVDGIDGGFGIAASEDGSTVYFKRQNITAFAVDRYYTPAGAPANYSNNVILGFPFTNGDSHTPRIGTGTLGGYLYAPRSRTVIQKNLATGEEMTLLTNGGIGVALSYDGSGNLWVAQSDRVMRVYPPPGGYFGVQYSEAIYTRDDTTANSHAPLTLSAPGNLQGTVPTNAGFDLSGITGRVTGAGVLRAGVLSSDTGAARLDAQFGVRSALTPPAADGADVSWSDNAYPGLEQGGLPLAYRDEWELPSALRLEIQQRGVSNGGAAPVVSPFPLSLVTRVTGVCGDPRLTDAPNSGGPRRKNTLTVRVTPTGLPKVSPGRCLDLTLPRSTVLLGTPGATWEIYTGQTLVAASTQPNGWDVEDDHTAYRGVHVTVPTGTTPGPYEVRANGVARGAGNFTVVTADTGTAPVLKPLLLSNRSVAGGTAVLLTVTLDRPAPVGGATVALWTTGSVSPLSLPDRVVFAAGETAATIPVVTAPGAATFYVRASYNGYRVARLDVDGGAEPPAGVTLTGFTVFPGVVTGGVSATGTVTLSGPAPEGGVRVALSASVPDRVPVPASVLVPAGYASVSFAVPTRPVEQAVPTVVTATLGANAPQAPLALLPQGEPPTVRITTPLDGDTITTPDGATTVEIPVRVEAKSSTAGVALASVEVFADGASLGAATGSGGDVYSVTWNAGLGDHRLTARATDAQGRVANSPPVTVTVTDKPTVQTPVISPPTGQYDRAFLTVTITCATPGAAIRYTVDGSDPETSGTARTYRNPFLVRRYFTINEIKARAFQDGMVRSNLASAVYVFAGNGGGGDPDAGGPLTARITAPGDGDTVTQPTDVTGLLSAPVLDGVSTAWELSARLAGSDAAWDVLGSGVLVGGTNLAVSGRFDPTLRLNGAYTLRLVAVTSDGRYAEDTVAVIVEGNMKIGNFRLSYTDLVVPVAGMPISVTRSYDTLAKDTDNDFGRGWSLQIANVRLQKSVPVHEYWEQRGEFVSPLIGKKYDFRQSRKHFLAVTFPSGQVMKFVAAYKPQSQFFLPIMNARVDWVPVGDTRATIRPVDPGDNDPNRNNVFVIPAAQDSFDYGLAWAPVYLGGYDDLEYDPDLWELKTLDGTVMHVSEARGLVWVREPNGNELSIDRGGIRSSTGVGVDFTRDGQGRITAIRDPKGNHLRYGIDGRGDLRTFTDRVGKSMTFTYDGAHALLTLTDPTGRVVTSNDYDPDTSRVVAVTGADGYPVTFTHGLDDTDVPDDTEIITDEIGRRTVLGFDKRGNVIQKTRYLRQSDGSERAVTTSSAYGDPQNPDALTSITDALGRTSRFVYGPNGEQLKSFDAFGRLVSSVTYNHLGKPLTIADADSVLVTNQYDEKGNLRKTINALGASRMFEYNPDGSVVKLFDEDNNVSSLTYDASGRGFVIGATDALGNTSEIKRDPNGNVTSKITTRTVLTPTTGSGTSQSNFDFGTGSLLAGLLFPNTGLQSPTIVDPCLAGGATPRVVRSVTDYAYDNSDRVVRRTFPDGKESLITFDDRGNVTEIRDVLGHIVRYGYDLKGRQTHTFFPDGTVASAEYDLIGRKKVAKDRGGRIVEYDWDTLDRLVKVTLRDAQGKLETMESYRYDDKDRLTKVTDALNRTSRIEYDALDRVRKVTDPVGQFIEHIYHPTKNLLVGVRDSSGRETIYQHDEMYRLQSVETPDGESTLYEYNNKGLLRSSRAPDGAKYTYDYDPLDRMARVTDPLNRAWTFGYDGHGNRTCRHDPNGNVTRFTYDEFNFGLLMSRTSPMGQKETYTYTDDFELKSVTDANGFTTRYAYENLSGFPRSITPDVNRGEQPIIFENTADGLVRSVSQGGSVNDFTYGGLGELKSDGTNAYAYDIVGNLKHHQTPTGRTTYEYDDANRLTKTTGADGQETLYHYDDQSRLASVTRPNGVATTYTYDVMDRVQTMTHAGTGFVSPYVHTYDVNGRLKTFSDETGVTAYSYDLVGQLTREESPRGVTTYTYDSVGNRETKTVATAVGSGSFVYQYDHNDRLLSVSGPAGTTTYEYDANGNCIRAGAVTLGYNFMDRLTSTQLATGSVMFVYDATGNRVAQTTPSGTTRYLVSGGQVVEETAPDGAVTRYEYDGSMLRSVRNGQSAWFLEDAIGSTGGLASDTGILADRWVYDAFGSPTRVAGTSGNTFLGIGGEQYDPATGLYYLRARFYDPQSGRFLSSDPLEGDDTYPATLNKYAYAGSDPVNNSDPSGLSFTLGEVNLSTSYSTMVRMAFFSGFNTGDSINRYGVSALQHPMAYNPDRPNDFQQIAEEGWMMGAARAASRLHPLIGMIVDTAENCYQTARSIEDAHKILMDPDASAEEKTMACYSVVYAFGEYAFNANQIAMGASQMSRSRRNGSSRHSNAMSEGEQISPRGARKVTVLQLRKSSIRAGGLDGSKKFTRRELRVLNEGGHISSRPEIVTDLPNRVTQRIFTSDNIRTKIENDQARNFFKRHKEDARNWWEKRTGKKWPSNATHDEHPVPLKDGGDPLFIEPGFDGPANPHKENGDFKRWGKQGGRPRKNPK